MHPAIRHLNYWLSNFLLSLIVLIALVTIGIRLYVKNAESKHSNRMMGADEAMFFKVAYLKIGNERVEKIYLKSWRDFPSESAIQITDTNGVVYLTSYSEVLLISEDK